MTEILAFLALSPVLSISLGFILAVILLFFLKDEIKAWVKKHYNLYDKAEVLEKLTEAVYDPSIQKYSLQVSRNANPDYKESFNKIIDSMASKLK